MILRKNYKIFLDKLSYKLNNIYVDLVKKMQNRTKNLRNPGTKPEVQSRKIRPLNTSQGYHCSNRYARTFRLTSGANPHKILATKGEQS